MDIHNFYITKMIDLLISLLLDSIKAVFYLYNNNLILKIGSALEFSSKMALTTEHLHRQTATTITTKSVLRISTMEDGPRRPQAKT
jgi:hypothetical protein